MATAAEVRLIMNVTDTVLTDDMIAPFIAAAEELVDKVFADDSDIGDTLLEEIKKWMTAHMIAATIHRTTSDEKLGEASVKFTGYWGKKLEATPYGQMVLILDTSGLMAKTGKMSATITAVESFEE